MRATARRLRRLEERLGPARESWQTQHLQARLKAARRRCGLPPISPARLAELRGMSRTEILLIGRRRAKEQAGRTDCDGVGTLGATFFSDGPASCMSAL